MVSTTSMLMMVFTLVIVFGVPLALSLYMIFKKKASVIAILVGALVFLISQLLTRIPLLQVLSRMDWYQAMAENIVLLALFLSITAALFEETGRYLGFRFLLKNKLETKNAIAFGVGHGGFEAISLIGLAYINNLVYSFMINTGTYDQTLGPALGDMADRIKDQLVSTPPTYFAAAGFERILTIIAHIAFSLLVYYAVRYRKPLYYGLALLAHTALNIGAVILPSITGDIWVSEIYLFFMALLGLVLIFKSREIEDNWQIQEKEN